jgi:hypothetical protein
MSTAAALWALVVQYLRPGLLIAKITKAWQVPPYPPRWHTWRKAKSKTDSPHTHVDERWSARGCNHGGGRIGRWSRRQTRRPTTTKTMVRACYETSSWAYNSHCAGRCRGWCRTNTGRRHMLRRPLPRIGWRGGGGMREERKEAGWRMRWRQLSQGPSL